MTRHRDHRHRRAGHQRPRRPTTSSAPSRTPRSSSRARPSPGSARPPRRRRPTSRSTPAAARCCPGFVDSHSHLVFAGDRAAEFAARMAGERYAAGGIRTTVAATRAATDEQLTSHVARLVAGDAPPGHHHGRDQERLRPDRPRRGAQPRGRATVHRGDDVPRRPRGARRAPTPEEYVALVTGPMLEACAPHARWIDAFCERGRVRRRPGAGRARGRGRGRAARAAARQPARARDPAYGWPASSGLAAVDHCTYLTDADVAALRDSGTIATLLPGRRVLDPAALPRRPPAARRRRPGRAGHRLQPRLVLHQLDAALHRARRPRDGDDPGRGGARRHRDAVRPRSTATTSAPSRPAGGPTSCCSTRPRHVHLAYRPGVPLVAATWIGGPARLIPVRRRHPTRPASRRALASRGPRDPKRRRSTTPASTTSRRLRPSPASGRSARPVVVLRGPSSSRRSSPRDSPISGPSPARPEASMEASRPATGQ